MRVVALQTLQEEILTMQGIRPALNPFAHHSLGPLRYSFPNYSFPTGAVHEFITESKESSASTTAFITGLLSSISINTHRKVGPMLWIAPSRKLFPATLKSFGIEPDNLIFADIKKGKDIMWAMDEALKCDALSAVVAEMSELSFTESRRLQLAVEKSRVTGFVLRTDPKKVGTTACVSRWKITPTHSESIDGMPGVGSPQWKVELLRIRNGKPGAWELRWENGKFNYVNEKDNNISLDEAPLRVNMV
jgi:protein ImuA